MRGKDLLSVSDLDTSEINLLISEAVDMESKGWLSLLEGKTMVLLFEKPSLRTRVSFETAMRQLGGESLYMSPAEVGLGERESVPDVARVLSRYADVIVARTFSHNTVKGLAESASIPVINALSDVEHPCQALADMLTIFEKKGGLEGQNLAYVGDGNNVAVSLMLAAVLTGVNFAIASPPDYSLDKRMLSLAQGYALGSGVEICQTDDPAEAVSGADVVYTDVWTSMGQEEESPRRRQAFASYKVTPEILSLAKADAIFMHPLPAHRGEEVSDEVLDGPRSVVFDQAENRLHIQKALLAHMLGGLEIPLPGYL